MISFDFWSVTVWPNTIPRSEHQALTIWIQSLLSRLLKDRRSVFPSIAITPLRLRFLIHFAKHSENCCVSRDEITRFNVSCDGIPPGSSRNDSKNGALHLAKSSMSLNVSAPDMTAQSTIVIISISLWRVLPVTRGSSILSKCFVMIVLIFLSPML